MDKRLLILKLLEIRLYTIKILRTLSRNNLNFIDWHAKTISLLKFIFGNDPLVDNFINVRFFPQKNLYYNYCLNKEELSTCYLLGLDKSESILKEAVREYSKIFLNKEIISSQLDNTKLDFDEIKVIVNSIGCTESEKIALINEFEKNNYAFKNIEDENHKKMINNQIAQCLNKIHPKIPGFLVFSSLIEILETFIYQG